MTSTSARGWRVAARAALVCGAVLLGACSARQVGTAQPSGFLGDYAQLHAGNEGQALLVYVNPATNFATYTKILIDPVTIWHSKKTVRISRDEALILADDLDDALRLALHDDYKLVQQPGPGVMRLRVAITEAEGSRYVEGTIGYKLDPELRAAMGPQPSGDTRSFVGEAGIEAEMLDAATGERLLAAVDRRAGAHRLRPKSDTWADVDDAFRYWAQRLQTRLAELRQRR